MINPGAKAAGPVKAMVTELITRNELLKEIRSEEVSRDSSVQRYRDIVVHNYV